MYKVESEFEYKGYKCVVTFSDMGHRCGYVGIPEGHILYGKHYSDYLNIPKSEIENEPIGKRGIISLVFSALDDNDNVKLELYFDVHGGITYSNKDDTYPIESDLWWLGFDCAHYGDGKDMDLVEKYWGDDPHIQKRIEFEKEYLDYYPVRSQQYVEDECRSLVDQIEQLVNRKE